MKSSLALGIKPFSSPRVWGYINSKNFGTTNSGHPILALWSSESSFNKLKNVVLVVLLNLFLCQTGISQSSFSGHITCEVKEDGKGLVMNDKEGSIEDTSIIIDNDVIDRSVILSSYMEQDVNNKEVFHLFSHGRPGELFLEGKWRTPVEIAYFLKGKLKEAISLNIYGCSFGQGDKGFSAIKYLESVLNIPISASDDITGINGDWDLEIGSNNNSLAIPSYNYDLQCSINGNTPVALNVQNEIYSGPAAQLSYSWSVISGDAIIDGPTTDQNVRIDFGTMTSVLQLMVTDGGGSSTCTLEVVVQDSYCPPLPMPVYNKEDDLIITSYHAHIAKGTYDFFTWGEDMGAPAGTDATVMTAITPANGYTYTGTPIMFALSTNTDGQAFLLTTTGMWSWGDTPEVVGGTIVSSNAFSSMTMPPGVTPADVLDIKANSDVFFLVTTTGNVWVAGQNVVDVSGNASTTANTWHQVEQDPGGTPLTGVVELTGSREVVYVRKADNTIWAWGDGIALGGGAGVTDRTFATQVDLSALPVGVTLSQLGTYFDNVSNSSGLLALGSDAKLYGIGYSGDGRLINDGTGFVNDWTPVQDGMGADLTEVLFIATSDNSEEYATASMIRTVGGVNNLYVWGETNIDNIGFGTGGLVQDPTLANGFVSGVDDPVYTSVGGHATSYLNASNGGSICFVGHITNGSGAGLQNDPTMFQCFGQMDVGWPAGVELCNQVCDNAEAGTGGSTSTCETSTTSIILADLLTGEDPGGTWTRISGSGGTFNDVAGTFTPAIGATTSVFRYTVDVPDPCFDDEEDVTVNISAIILSLTITEPTCNGGSDGSIEATVTGGTGPYDYSWSGPVSGSILDQPSPYIITGLSTGTYTVSVTDNEGCPDNTNITVTQPEVVKGVIQVTKN